MKRRLLTYDRLTFYRRVGQWRWRYQAAGNGAKLAHGGEGYRKLGDAIDSSYRVCGILSDVPVSPTTVVITRPDGRVLMIVFPE